MKLVPGITKYAVTRISDEMIIFVDIMIIFDNNMIIFDNNLFIFDSI